LQALKKQNLVEDGLQLVSNEPEPRVGHSEVKIRVEAASICGTDQSIYQITSRPGMRDEMLNYNGGDVSRYSLSLSATSSAVKSSKSAKTSILVLPASAIM